MADSYRYHGVFWQHRVVRFTLSLLLMLVTAVPAFAQQTPPDSMVELVVKTNEFLGNGYLGLSPNDQARGWSRVTVPVEGTIQETVEKLSSSMNATVGVNWRYPLLGPEAEPRFVDQWGLENTGQAGGTPDADTDAAAAWPVSKGAGIVVAVIDSGVDPTNSELDGQLWTNAGEVPGDGKDNDGNGFNDDVDGWDFMDDDNDPSPEGASLDDAHGTLVAGVLGAEVNGAGITGVAPEVTIMNLRACDNGFCESFEASTAIFYAVDMGADIVNLSFGSPIPAVPGDPMMEAAIDYAEDNDVLVVTAAGNTPPGQVAPGDLVLPAEFPHVNNIAVAASDRRDRISSFSYYSPDIDIAAPGEQIISTGLDGYYNVSGTSFSAPLVAGVAALLKSTDKTMSHVELADRIKGFADRPASIGTKTEAGRLNAGTALNHPFLDAVGHLFESDIEWAAGQGITKGCNPPLNTFFCPEDPVSREVMAAFLNRYLDLAPASKDHFTDDDGSIFENDINRLAEAGITRGCGGTNFCPKNVVDRGQMAAFLVRAFGLSDDGGGDLFVDDDNSIFEHDIDILGTAGITKGCNPPSNDNYCPGLPVDRGAMTAFLHRAPGP